MKKMTTFHISSTATTPIVHSFFPLNDLKNYEGVANPLLGIQVTDLADGIFIDCTMNHSVDDGSSFWHFFNLWSEISKGSIPLSKLPIFQSWLPNGIDFPICIPKSYLQQVYAEDQFIVPPIQERVFHFTREKIAKLKAKANAEVGTNNISSLQALPSHIWQSVIRNRNCDGDEETSFRIAIGARHRLQELPDGYFGNALLGTLVMMKAKQLLNEGIGKVAREMKRMIGTVTEQSFKSFLVSWPANPYMVTMDFMTNRNKYLVTSSSPRFNIYGNDFGWGKPIASQTLTATCRGDVYNFGFVLLEHITGRRPMEACEVSFEQVNGASKVRRTTPSHTTLAHYQLMMMIMPFCSSSSLFSLLLQCCALPLPFTRLLLVLPKSITSVQGDERQRKGSGGFMIGEREGAWLVCYRFLSSDQQLQATLSHDSAAFELDESGIHNNSISTRSDSPEFR
ncbi:Transferase [Corchorus olitorius]|uniref:Transferase n=1 Tax=Corchorus olitorius TaxID=93759 RepID=A0A1R3GJ53_9ROSI|nr:Transferase [Corchorus olitorius]